MEQTTPNRAGLVAVTEAADATGVPAHEIRKAIHSKDIPHSSRILVNLDDVRTWAARRDAS